MIYLVHGYYLDKDQRTVARKSQVMLPILYLASFGWFQLLTPAFVQTKTVTLVTITHDYQMSVADDFSTDVRGPIN